MRHKFHLILCALALVCAAAWADEPTYTTYFQQNYTPTESEGAVVPPAVDWTMSGSGTYTVSVETQDATPTTSSNYYLNVAATGTGGNGVKVTSPDLSGGASFSDFSLEFDMHVRNGNNQASYLEIFGADNKILFKIAATDKATTIWKINDGVEVDLPDTYASTMTWLRYKVIWKAGKTYVKITKVSDNSLILDLKEIAVLNDGGGISKIEYNTKRYYSACQIDNILVRSLVADDVPPMYTVQYVDGSGNTLKSEKFFGKAGASITITDNAKSDIISGEKKYAYVSDDSEGKTVAEDGSTVVTLTYRELATISYKVYAKCGDSDAQELTSGSCFEGDNVYVPYPRYINNGGTLYKKDATNQQYKYNYTPAVSEPDATLDYTKTTIAGVVFFSEAEDITTLTKTTVGQADSRSSMAAGGYLPGTDPVKVTTLEAGYYTISAAIFGTADATYTFSLGDKTFAMTTNGSWHEATNETIKITETTDLTVSQTGANSQRGLDFVYVATATPAAISAPEAQPTESGAIYDLQGRRVSKPAKGLYIQNGKLKMRR